MGITHEWNGSVLTITSDSGTSSADLRGEKGDTGIRGPQGIKGNTGEIDDKKLEAYATKEFVQVQVAEAQLPEKEVDLSAFYTKSETENVIKNETNKLSNTLKGKVSGTAVSVTDVSPVEHDLKVKLESKNLFDKNNTANLLDGYITGDGVYMASSGGEKSFIFKCKPNTNYVISKLLGNTNRVAGFETIPSSGTAGKLLGEFNDKDTYTFNSGTANYIVVWYLNNYGETVTNAEMLDSIQLEYGTTATEYTPYMSNLSLVTVERYGKNLFNLERFEANLAEGRWHYVEFNGRRCIKNIPGAECILTGYMKIQFPTPIQTFQVDAYCAEDTATIFSLFDITGNTTLRYMNASTDINNWTMRHEFGGNDVGYFSLYCYSPYDVYIDLDSIIAVVDTETEPFEPFTTPQVAMGNPDGTVDGFTSSSSSMTITTDYPGVLVDVEYNKDINKAYAELVQAIISLGGNV